MLNHERIHVLQARSFRLGYITFYVLYLWYWILGLFKYGIRHHAAYMHIPFELEAYDKQTDLNYHHTHWQNYK